MCLGTCRVIVVVVESVAVMVTTWLWLKIKNGLDFGKQGHMIMIMISDFELT